MQTHPSRPTQVILTALGLGLMIFAILLNHYHPRNAGVAATNHNSINLLALDVRQMSTASGSAIVALGKLPEAKVSAASRGDSIIQTSANGSQVRIIQASIVSIESAEIACGKLDSQEFRQVERAYDSSYKTYLSAKRSLQNSYKPSDVDIETRAEAYYQSYLNALASTYSSYQLALMNQDCQPLAVVPVPEDQ